MKPIDTSKTEALRLLVADKFGNEYGYIRRAATALNVQHTNLSSMLRGVISVPAKYLTALEALPSYAPGVTWEQTTEGISKRFSVVLDEEAQSDLEFISRFYTEDQYVGDFKAATNDHLLRFFKIMLENSRLYLQTAEADLYEVITLKVGEEQETEQNAGTNAEDDPLA
jgi:hypothetical protein